MGMTNHHRTWSRKPRLIGVNHGSSNHREENALDEGHGQMKGQIWSTMNHLKLFVYEIIMATVEDLTARIVIALADVISTSDLVERIRQSFVHRCWLGYDLRDCNFNNTCDNPLSLHF
ncbi:hypothetical protein TNCV_2833591 [Trichonephila clavipes]|nr:hypothetical protein TNCV_2833591 [Trichonephila clavipes]